MKIIFLLQGSTHYYNLVLGKLNKIPDINIVEVVPQVPHNLGAGVYHTNQGVDFKIHLLEEYPFFPPFFFFKDLWKLLIKEKPDIVVATKLYLRGFIFHLPTLLVMRLFNIKLVLKDHPFKLKLYQELRDEISKTTSSGKKNIFKQFRHALLRYYRLLSLEVDRFLFNFPDALVCYVEEAFDIFGSYGIKKEKIFITYNSPDTDLLFAVRQKLEKIPKLTRNRCRIIHIGRLVAWKKVDLLIRSFANAKNKFKKAELLIIGQGPEEETLKQLSSNLKVARSIRFLGGVYDYNKLGEYLLSSAVYVLAGMGGISINDAMSFGLPIICSVCDGTEKKLVREGYNGFYFREDDENDLTDKITYLFSHPKLIQTMGIHSTEIIRKEINIHKVIKGYQAAFKYVLGR